MPQYKASAIAHPNIAFIKYWGNLDDTLRIPRNSSLSMNLAALTTTTSVEFDSILAQDELTINDDPAHPAALERVSAFLDIVRTMADMRSLKARVISHNNFPMGAGIASSASAFAALAAAASQAAGLHLNEKNLSRLARRGSGSACRSVPSGFVEWQAGHDDETSYAFSIAPITHWNLVDLIAVVDREHKQVGSSAGHKLAATSPIQVGRVSDCPRRLQICRQAILEKDFAVFSEIVEQDSNLLHAIMMTSSPSLLYWEPATIQLMKNVSRWRAEGLQVCYTIDAGPNVHLICTEKDAQTIEDNLASMSGISTVIRSTTGDGVQVE